MFGKRDHDNSSLGDLFVNEDKLKALIASRYLNSIEKGNNALELVKVLEENMENENCCECFKVPKYIKDAIEWLCK